MQNFLNQIETKLKQTHQKNDSEYAAFRSKTTKLKVLGHRLPAIHELVKNGFSFYNKSESEIIKTWNHVWKNTKFHEVMYLPLFYYRNLRKQLGRKEWNVLRHWIDQIENWEHADALTYLYSILFEKHPELVMPTLKKWNRSKNPWKQRASIVTLIYYASPNRKAPPVNIILPMVEPLIGSKDKYVNKGVGWTLRECYKLYPKPTYQFIKKYVGVLSADGFSYSTEKVTKSQKVELKKLRALARKK